MPRFDGITSHPELDAEDVRQALDFAACNLDPGDRSHLLERLIASLDSDPEVEEAWELEADRREAELESSSIEAIPGPEAIARLRAKLSK